MYPSQVMTIRSNDDRSDPYWLPVVDDEGKLVTEPGESVLVELPGSVMLVVPGASGPVKLTECWIGVTERRSVWLTTELDKGHGPGMGSLLGPAAAAIELASSVGSHAMAARRRKRRILAGHVRNEWVGMVTWASEENRAAVTLATIMSTGKLTKVYFMPHSHAWLTYDVAAWWARSVVQHRLGLGVALTSEADAELRAQLAGGPESPHHHAWPVPGWSEDTIAAAYGASGLA